MLGKEKATNRSGDDGVSVSLGNHPAAPVVLFFPFLDRRSRPGIDGLKRYAPFLLAFRVLGMKEEFFAPRWESLN